MLPGRLLLFYSLVFQYYQASKRRILCVRICTALLSWIDHVRLVVPLFVCKSLPDRFLHLITARRALTRYTNSLGPVVQSVVSLTSSLRVISLTVLADSIYNILIFFAEKM